MEFKKYYDAERHLVGVSMGNITGNVEDIANNEVYEHISRLLADMPEKVGYTTYLIENTVSDNVEFSDYKYDFEPIPDVLLTNEELIEKFKDDIINSIVVENRPRLAEKEGYHIVPVLNGTTISWEYEKDDNFVAPEEDVDQGSYLNPIPYVDGMYVKPTKWYTDGDNIWEAIQYGMPNGFDDTQYFDIIQ